MGRAGRGGEPSICVFLHLKNQRLPKEMRPFFKTDSSACQRRALTEIFTLHDTDGSIFATNSFMAIYHMSNSVVYATKESRVQCSEACVKQGRCTCSKCKYIHFGRQYLTISSVVAPTAPPPASLVRCAPSWMQTRWWRLSWAWVEQSTSEHF